MCCSFSCLVSFIVDLAISLVVIAKHVVTPANKNVPIVTPTDPQAVISSSTV